MPALALARAAADAGHEPVLVGATRGIEAQILPSHPFRYYLLPLEPIYRRAWWRNLRWPLTLWRVWRAAVRMLDVERPALAIGTGGYAAGPRTVVAFRLCYRNPTRIPDSRRVCCRGRRGRCIWVFPKRARD
jgi:UDP-N-acetylglucosamine--N-acetylmuramyl-(pentapeptide) pyrophosphoryl-undecaprenol N-acetylglucosamine transferase